MNSTYETVVIYGPRCTGKTLNAKLWAAHFGMAQVLDGLHVKYFKSWKRWEALPVGALVLVLEEDVKRLRYDVGRTLVIDVEAAFALAGGVRPDPEFFSREKVEARKKEGGALGATRPTKDAGNGDHALAGAATGADAGKSAHAPLGEGALGTTRPTYEALALELAELRGRYAADVAMLNERLGERTQGMLAALVRARLAASAPSFRAGWAAAIERGWNGEPVGIEEAVRRHLERKGEEVPEAAADRRFEEALEWLNDECFDLRCETVYFHDDSDVTWCVYSHHIASPKLRLEGQGRTALEAIHDAMRASGDPLRTDAWCVGVDMVVGDDRQSVEKWAQQRILPRGVPFILPVAGGAAAGEAGNGDHALAGAATDGEALGANEGGTLGTTCPTEDAAAAQGPFGGIKRLGP